MGKRGQRGSRVRRRGWCGRGEGGVGWSGDWAWRRRRGWCGDEGVGVGKEAWVKWG